MAEALFQEIRHLVQNGCHGLHERVCDFGLSELVQRVFAICVGDAPHELRPRCQVDFELAEFDDLRLHGTEEFFGSSA